MCHASVGISPGKYGGRGWNRIIDTRIFSLLIRGLCLISLLILHLGVRRANERLPRIFVSFQ